MGDVRAGGVAAYKGDVADVLVALCEFRHECGKLPDELAAWDGLLVLEQRLRLGLGSCGTRLAFRADGLGLGVSLSAKRLGLGGGLRAQSLGLRLGASANSGRLSNGRCLPGLGLSLNRVGLGIRFLLRDLSIGLGFLLACERDSASASGCLGYFSASATRLTSASSFAWRFSAL